MSSSGKKKYFSDNAYANNPKTPPQTPPSKSRKKERHVDKAMRELPEVIYDYEPPRFDFSIPEERKAGLEFLENEGYCVVKAVLSEEDVKTAKNLTWDFLEGIPARMETQFPGFAAEFPAIKRNDPRTWTDGWPGLRDKGIVGDWGAGQSPLQWFVRSRQRVKETFAAIWDTNELVTSFDGFGLFRPYRYDPLWKTRGGWYHVDQHPIYKPNKCCIQGLVSVYDTNRSVGGLTVIPKSHLQFIELGNKLQESKKISMAKHDYVPIPLSEEVLQTAGIVVNCKAGDLCLWDSRTIHCNSPSPCESKASAHKKSSSKEGSWDLIRIASYVCMTPRAWANSGVLARRQQAVKDNQTTTHWPHQFYPNGRAQPAFLGKRYIDVELI